MMVSINDGFRLPTTSEARYFLQLVITKLMVNNWQKWKSRSLHVPAMKFIAKK